MATLSLSPPRFAAFASIIPLCAGLPRPLLLDGMGDLAEWMPAPPDSICEAALPDPPCGIMRLCNGRRAPRQGVFSEESALKANSFKSPFQAPPRNALEYPREGAGHLAVQVLRAHEATHGLAEDRRRRTDGLQARGRAGRPIGPDA